MFDYIENLRKKPEAERRKAVFRISLTLTCIIAGIWGISLFLGSRSGDLVAKNGGKPDDMPSLKETLSTFFGQVEKIIKNKDDIGVPEDSLGSLLEQEMLAENSSTTLPIVTNPAPSMASTTGTTSTQILTTASTTEAASTTKVQAR